MLARDHFLLPCLYFRLLGESVGFQNAVHDAGNFAAGLINIFETTLEAFDSSRSIIAIRFSFGRYSQL